MAGKGTRKRVDALDLLQDEYNEGDRGRERFGTRRPKDPDGAEGAGTESCATTEERERIGLAREQQAPDPFAESQPRIKSSRGYDEMTFGFLG